MTSTQSDRDSTQVDSEPLSPGDNTSRNDNGARTIESLEAPPAQGYPGPDPTSTVRGALSKIAFMVYICTIIAYLFLSAQGLWDGQGGVKTARLVVLLVWMVTSGVLFLCHARYLVRHKREIASTFFISAVGLHFLVGTGETAITDGIGVVMVCIVVAALCPGLLEPLGMVGPT